MEFFKSKIMKKFYATLLTIVFAFSLCVPYNAIAQTGTMGTESPDLIATFTNSTGDECCGDSLEAGEYNIQLVLSGMSSVSLFQITADYTDAITINSVTTVADTNSQFHNAIVDYEDNNFKAVILSENDDTTLVSSSGEVMISLNVTVNTAGDFEDYFIVSNDPQLTFVEADFGDGVEMCYVHISNQQTDIEFPRLTIDMSPDLTVSTFDVKGQILISKNPACTSTSGGVNGITVSVNGTNISDSTHLDPTVNEKGYYTLEGLEEGTYTLTIAGPTTIDRTVTLEVSADKAVNGVINVDALPMVICDYNHDKFINGLDTSKYFGALKGSYNVYMDLTADGYINGLDTSIYFAFLGKTITYQDVTL